MCVCTNTECTHTIGARITSFSMLPFMLEFLIERALMAVSPSLAHLPRRYPQSTPMHTQTHTHIRTYENGMYALLYRVRVRICNAYVSCIMSPCMRFEENSVKYKYYKFYDTGLYEYKKIYFIFFLTI